MFLREGRLHWGFATIALGQNLIGWDQCRCTDGHLKRFTSLTEGHTSCSDCRAEDSDDFFVLDADDAVRVGRTARNCFRSILIILKIKLSCEA